MITSDDDRKTSDNEWKQVTMNDNDWQQVTTSENEWYNNQQRMTSIGTSNETKWERMRASKIVRFY